MEEGKNQGMKMDDIELTLRRFAMARNDTALTKLLNSMFVESPEAKVKHEMSSSDPVEDMKEKE